MKASIVKQKVIKMRSLYQKAEQIWQEIDFETKIKIEKNNPSENCISDIVFDATWEMDYLFKDEKFWKKLDK